MARDQITLREWEPSAQQLKAADALAAGRTQQATADLVKVDIRTVQRWLTDPQFAEHVQVVRGELLANIHPKYTKLVDTCLDILDRIGEGQLDPDSSLAEWAERILNKTLFPVVLARGVAAAGVPVDLRGITSLASSESRTANARRIPQARSDRE